jgi:DNA-directed RNA polymerase subunit RPC12/RpoP
MADIKFSCPQCGQHFGCDQAWEGQQIECPGCHSSIVVPQTQRPVPAAPAQVMAKEPAKSVGPRLAPGVTQVARSTAHAPAAIKRAMPRRPGGENTPLKYTVWGVVIAILVGAGYFYGLPLITGALNQEPTANSPGNPKPSQSGATMGGPMGDVSGAMDVSETLDGGSSTRTRPAPATNHTAQPRATAPRH